MFKKCDNCIYFKNDCLHDNNLRIEYIDYMPPVHIPIYSYKLLNKNNNCSWFISLKDNKIKKIKISISSQL